MECMLFDKAADLRKYIEQNDKVPLHFKIKISKPVVTAFLDDYVDLNGGQAMVDCVENLPNELARQWRSDFQKSYDNLASGVFELNASNGYVLGYLIHHAAFDVNENESEQKRLQNRQHISRLLKTHGEISEDTIDEMNELLLTLTHLYKAAEDIPESVVEPSGNFDQYLRYTGHYQ